MERVPLESKAVTSAGDDAAAGELEVEFRNGRVYRYEGVPRSVWEWVLERRGTGAYVSRMVVDRCPYRDVTPGPSEAQDVEAALRASLEADDSCAARRCG